MAEIVQQRIEDRIPELEQLERVGLFTRKEVKAMVKKVSALEYKLHRRIISKEDFITYIQRIGYTFKREEIEFTIIHRINNVFRRATAKWKNTTTQLSKVFSSMLAIHPDKPAFWIMAAKWEMEDRTSSESARLLFLRALRFHPDNQKLYQEYFRMELMHAEKLRKEQKALEQAKMDLLCSATSPSRRCGHTYAVVVLVSLFSLQSLHADDPLTWDFMAKRELEVESLPSSEHESKQTKALEVGRREERCCAVYEEAVTAVPTEAMWLRYVTFCYERFKRKSNNEDLKQKRREKALAVFQRAHESLLLAESLYKQWETCKMQNLREYYERALREFGSEEDSESSFSFFISDLCRIVFNPGMCSVGGQFQFQLQVLLAVGLMDTAAEVAIAAARRFSQSLDTWQSCLQVLVSVRSHDVPTLFEEALAHIKPKESLPLWILRVEWTEEMQSLEDTEAFFQPGQWICLHNQAVCSGCCAIVSTEGTAFLGPCHLRSDERKVFGLVLQNRRSEEGKEGLYKETCKMQNLREYYERALREFGSEEDNLWLDYIKEELNHPQGKPENCGKIHWRAMRVLQGERVERFIAKYTLAQTGHL
ncbi:UNVERIFIED_CONTAM: hypothetical protein FKN15_014338 [Acipenser sinensis]